MKLTDEQREQMWQPNTLSMLRYNLVNGTQTISNDEVVTLIDDIQKLRSSEQTWREEAERKDGKIKTYDYNYQRVLKQINQAIEVLKLIADGNIYFPSWADTVDVLIDVRKIARETVSSLQEDKP